MKPPLVAEAFEALKKEIDRFMFMVLADATGGAVSQGKETTDKIINHAKENLEKRLVEEAVIMGTHECRPEYCKCKAVLLSALFSKKSAQKNEEVGEKG